MLNMLNSSYPFPLYSITTQICSYKMEGKEAVPIDPMIAPVYYQTGPTPFPNTGPTPFPNTMAYPQDNANQMFLPHTYNVATIQHQQNG